MSRSPFNDLSGLLWRERDVLDAVIARLENGDDPPEALFRSISSLELHRAITAREAGIELGLEGEPTLVDLIAAAPPEWRPVLSAHHEALVRLTAEVERNMSLQRSLREFIVSR